MGGYHVFVVAVFCFLIPFFVVVSVAAIFLFVCLFFLADFSFQPHVPDNFMKIFNFFLRSLVLCSVFCIYIILLYLRLM